MVAVRHFSCFQVSRISYQERFISHRFTICWILIRSVHVFEKQGLCCGLKRIWTFHSPPNYKLIAYSNVATSLSIVQTLFHLVGNTVHTTSTYDPLLMQHLLTDLDDMKVLTTTRFFFKFIANKSTYSQFDNSVYISRRVPELQQTFVLLEVASTSTGATLWRQQWYLTSQEELTTPKCSCLTKYCMINPASISGEST